MSNNAFNLGNLVNHNELLNMLKIDYEKINTIINSNTRKFNDLEKLSIESLKENFLIDEDIAKVIIVKLHDIIFSSSVNDLNTERIMNDLFELNFFHDDEYSLKDYIIEKNNILQVKDHDIFTLIKTIILCKMHEKIITKRNNNNTNNIDINEELNKKLHAFIGKIHIPNGMKNDIKNYNFFEDKFLKQYNIPQEIGDSMNIVINNFITNAKNNGKQNKTFGLIVAFQNNLGYKFNKCNLYNPLIFFMSKDIEKKNTVIQNITNYISNINDIEKFFIDLYQKMSIIDNTFFHDKNNTINNLENNLDEKIILFINKINKLICHCYKRLNDYTNNNTEKNLLKKKIKENINPILKSIYKDIKNFHDKNTENELRAYIKERFQSLDSKLKLASINDEFQQEVSI